MIFPYSQGYLFQSEDGKNEHIFSGDFKSFVAELLITSLKILEGEKIRKKDNSTAAAEKKKKEEAAGITTILNAIGDFVNGGPSVELADTEKTEQEKVAQHLTFVTEKLALLFNLDQVMKDFSSLPHENLQDR